MDLNIMELFFNMDELEEPKEEETASESSDTT